MQAQRLQSNNFMNKRYCVLIITLIFYVSPSVFASETSGTISDSYRTTRICKNEICGTYGTVNWKPTLNAQTTGATAVTITDNGITGWLWGDEIGWVNMDPTGSGVTINSTTSVLSGYAYANTGSWINFAPTTFGAEPVGITISSSGKFSGWAYVSGMNGGWMRFDCPSASTCIETDWRPVGARTTANTITTQTSQNYSSGSRSIWSIIMNAVPFFGRSNNPPLISENIATNNDSGNYGSFNTSDTANKLLSDSSYQADQKVEATSTVLGSKTVMAVLTGITLVIIVMIIWRILFVLL